MLTKCIALSIIAAIWGQLEYSAAKAQPWLQLQRKPLPASDNLLLNYVSPWSVASLGNSLFARHFPVTLANLGGILLKAAIVVSTGLFALEQRRPSYPVKVNLVENFNMTRKTTGEFDSPMDLAFILRTVADSKAPYPRGVTSDVAALSVSFNMPDNTPPPPGSNVFLTAAVPVFSADLQDCEAFSWSFNSSDTTGKGFSLAEIMPPADMQKLSPFCLATEPFSNRDPIRPSLTSLTSPYRYNGLDLVFQHVNCSSIPLDKPLSQEIMEQEMRLFASVVLEGANNNTLSVSALLCTPRYSITRRQVTSSDGHVISVSDQVLETFPLGENPAIITSSLAERLQIARLSIPEPERTLRGESTLFQIMNYTTSAEERRNFTNVKIFEQAVRRTWKTTSAITVKLDYTKPASAHAATKVEEQQTFEATVNVSASRLVVMPVPLRVLEAIVVVLVVSLSLLAVAFDFTLVKNKPPSLLNSAIVLANSERLEKRFLSDVSPATPQEQFGECLDGHLFNSQPLLDGGGGVRVVVDKAWQHDFLANISAKPRGVRKFGQWWLPTTATRWYRIGILVTTLVCLVVLEVLSQLSRKNGGLADLAGSSWAQYTYNWGPTIIMSGLGLAYVAMDRAVRELHVFAELSRRPNRQGSLDTLRFEPNASLSPVTLVRALGRRHYGLAALVTCSILASILTISASGLFVAETIPKSESVELQPLGWFDARDASKFGYNQRVDMKSLEAFYNQGIQFHNISEPVGIYGSFAFAALDTNQLLLPLHNSTALTKKLRTRIPAVRAQSNCTLYSHQPITRNVTRRNFEVKVEPPRGCTPGARETLSDGKYIHLSANAGQAPHDGFFGFLSDLSWSLLPAAHNETTGMFTPVNRDPYTVCADSTQHTWIHYGRYDEAASTLHDLTVLQCIPFLEALVVEVTFNLPNLTVDTPPRPITFPSPWNFANRSLNSIPFSGPLAFSGTGMNYDSFFTVLTRGIHGVPGTELLGRERVDAMIRKVNDVYGELGAVFLSANCRVSLFFPLQSPVGAAPVPALRGLDNNGGIPAINSSSNGRPEPAGAVPGEILSFAPGEVKVRLVQREVPTRLLEGLLLCMAGLGILGFWLVGNLANVLPQDPGSVAVQMSLFAGSNLVDRLKTEGEKGLEGERLFLGWWEVEGGGKMKTATEAGPGRRYGIDVMEEDSGS